MDELIPLLNELRVQGKIAAAYEAVFQVLGQNNAGIPPGEDAEQFHSRPSSTTTQENEDDDACSEAQCQEVPATLCPKQIIEGWFLRSHVKLLNFFFYLDACDCNNFGT